MSESYVYILYREDGVTPFYVGKGKRDRWLAHERDCRRGRSHKDNIIAQMVARGVQVPKRKIAEGLTDDQAAAFEIKTIAEIGREPDGPLVNITAGGEGCLNPTAAARARMSDAHKGKTASEETRRKMSDASRGRAPSPLAIERSAAAKRGKPLTIAVRAKISDSLRGRKNGPHSDQTRAAISAALKGKRCGPPATPEINAKRSASLRAAWALVSPEDRASRGMAGRKHAPETIERMRTAARGRVIGAETRTKIGAAQVGRRASDETRARMTASQKERWDIRRAAT